MTDIALSEREIVHEVAGITKMGEVDRRDVWFSMLLHLAHVVFQPSKFSTDQRPINVPVAS